MLLTKELLIEWNACEEGIAFCERNKLFGFDLNKIDEIQGDYKGFINWLKCELNIKRVYDKNKNITEIIYNKNVYKKYFYNSSNKLIKIIDSTCYWTITEYYDINGLQYKETTSDGNWITWEYDSIGNKIKEVSSNNPTITWQYDTENNVITEKHQNTDIWFKYYYNNKLLIKEESFDGHWWIWDYNKHNKCIKESHSDGFDINITYDNNGNKIKESHSDGFIISYKYDKNNNIIEEIHSDGYSVLNQTEFYNNGQLKRIGELELPLI